MVVKKEDKRVVKTKRDLRNALSALIKSKPYEKITVCDICQEAVINRMTFYKHYMDKNDLLSDMFDFARVSAGAIETLKNSDGNCEDVIRIVLPIVKQIASECVDKKDIIKAMFDNDSDIVGDVIYKSLHDVATRIFEVYMQKHTCKYDYELICQFLVGGLTKVLTSFTAQKEDYPKDKFISDVISVFEIIMNSEIFE